FLLGRVDQALRLRWIWPILLLVLGVGILADLARHRGSEDGPALNPPPEPEPAPRSAAHLGPEEAPDLEPERAEALELKEAPDREPEGAEALGPEGAEALGPEGAVDNRE